MKLTIKLFLIFAIATSTIFADGDMNNGGYDDDGDMNNGGKTCTVNCPVPPFNSQTEGEENNETSDENSDNDNSILTTIEEYLKSLFG